MDETSAQTQGRKTSRWVKILLAASLAANLLMIGAAVGAGFRAKSGAGGNGGSRSGFAFVAALEKDDRRAIVKETREFRRATQREAREDIMEILAELRSDSFDLESFSARLSTQKARVGAMQDTVSDALVAQVGEMTPAERVAYADRVEKLIERRGKSHGGKKNKKDSKP